MDKKTAMENLARKAHEKGVFNGTWLYAENGQIISKGALGFRDAEDKLPMQEDSIFEMASITKQFTAAAVMLLVREGKLRLDDEYTKFFPEYPYQGVTIRHLLTHTSGMPDDFYTSDWVVPVLEKENRIPACSEILRFICESSKPAACAPGEKYRYTDVGYCLIANVVEKVSGIMFEDFLKKNLFEPAGMKDTAILHTRRDGRPSDRFTRNMVLENGRYVPSDISEEDRGYVVGSDGLNGCDYAYTTIFDMFAWDRALHEETVLTKDEQAEMYAPTRLSNGELVVDDDLIGKTNYGLGWGVLNDPKDGLIVCHSGGMPGLRTWFERFVDADKVLVILNCRDCVDAKAYMGFREGMEAIVRGKEPEPLKTVEELALQNPDRSNWSSFCGSYEWEDYRIDIQLKDNGLFAIFSLKDKEEPEVKLFPIGEKTFALKTDTSDMVFVDGGLTLYGIEGKKTE